ncbi:hypothetical protein ACH42_11310 [Endozoicomonas sp. (ex Bugula neritina AB1)]|nr:hypothetical protein ACH42_11310 [Endozoicomonas sp. (ex Bugula neritina AB1)]
MNTSTVAIIGVGPRGLSILERIIAYSLENRKRSIHIYLYDPNTPGSGCHDINQPEHLLVNTVAEQITQFSDPSIENSGSIIDGPSFYEWLSNQTKFEKSLGTVNPNAYYSRSLFGKYLNWVFNYLIELAPNNITIDFHQEKIINIDKCDSSGNWTLHTKNNSQNVNFFFLTTGHTHPEENKNERRTLINNPYPISKLEHISSKSLVAIEGMGLTFFDIVSHFTIGRGGVYKKSDKTKRLEYIKSGYEPKIIAYSRSGLPLSARAMNQKGVSGQYQAHFLTSEKVSKIKNQQNVSFMSDVLPSLLLDMQYAYYYAYIRERKGYIEAKRFCTKFKFLPQDKRTYLIESNIPEEDRFSWSRLSQPIPVSALEAPEKFKFWFENYLSIDLSEAENGNLSSPIKASCDVLRDLRDNIRSLIDFGRLSESSQRWLYTDFIPVMNRIAVGPPKERIEEMIALLNAGVLECNLGPGATGHYDENNNIYEIRSSVWPEYSFSADILIKARIPMHSPKDDSSPLMKSLLKKGYARLFYNGRFHPGGLEVDEELNLIDANGQSLSNAWALGMPSEGVKFYTFIVPRPGVNSTAILDAGNTVKQMLTAIDLHNQFTHRSPTKQIHSGVIA